MGKMEKRKVSKRTVCNLDTAEALEEQSKAPVHSHVWELFYFFFTRKNIQKYNPTQQSEMHSTVF